MVEITNSSPASIAEKQSQRRRRRARDDWSAVSNLPDRVAVEVDRERNIELCRAVPIPTENYPEEGREARVLLTIDRASAMKPKDVQEAMLADQLVITHAMMMECYARANAVSDSPLLFNSYLSQAMRLGALHLKQVAMFDKHRNNGQQKVVVEYVNVESGGNAVVGHIDARRQVEAPFSREASNKNSCGQNFPTESAEPG